MKNKIKKQIRPKAQTPKGFRDYESYDVIERDKMLKSVSEIYHHYGFDLLETSAVETVEALGKFLPDVERPNEGVFSWKDEDDKWLALRYDLTAPLARFYAQYRNQLTLPYRRFSMGPVWRNEKPGPGRFKQFYQCDADSIGVPNVTADAEICMMLSDIIENLGIPTGKYRLKINNRKILDGILDIVGLNENDGNEVVTKQRGIVLRAIDKLDRLGFIGVEQLLGIGRKDESGDFSYILSPQNIKAGDKIISSEKAEIKLGNCMQLKNIPTDTLIHNVEMKPGKGGQLNRSAGTYSQLIGKDSEYAQIKLSSGEIRMVRIECKATIGMVSNPDKKNIKLGKAGRKRWMGIRPVVRGVAMNPVDHPHGGGEGRTSGGRNPVSRKGFSAKGKKTRKNKRTDKYILRRGKK